MLEKEKKITTEENKSDIQKIITPKNDIIFKRIFGKRGNEEILKSFLESILDVKISEFSDFEMHIIELQKFRETDIIKPSKKEFWLWFIDYTKKEFIDMGVKDMKEVEKAYEEYKRITSDKALMNAIINMDMAEMDKAQEITDARLEGREEGIREGEALGEARGKEIGKEESKLEIAKKMLMSGIDDEKISDITGLSSKKIEELKKNLE